MNLGNWRSIFGAVFLMASLSVVAARFLLASNYQSAALEVCGLVEAHYFQSQSPEVIDFVSSCRDAAQTQAFIWSRRGNVARINSRLAVLRVSHLTLHAPEENKVIWENQGLESGIRSRLIDGTLVIHRVVPASPAARASLRVGDVILSINGERVFSNSRAQLAGGVLVFRRGETEGQVELYPEAVQDDLRTTLIDLGGESGLLRIPSFLPQYFEKQSWVPLAEGLSRFRNIIVDLRDNAGGSFSAMLRALSPFRCGNTLVGSIYRVQRPTDGAASLDFPDDLDAATQLSVLAQAATVNLRTFAEYGCFAGTVTVLTDSGTSSVAEVFAQALEMRARSRVWGEPTAGQVVLAQWLPVRGFGGGDFSLSVPIAGYRSADGIEIESQGVYPEKVLSYDLDSARRGRDNWIEEALAQRIRVSK